MNSMRDEVATAQLLERKEPWSGLVISVREDTLMLPGQSSPLTRSYTTHPGAVGILAVRGDLSDPQILVIQQYRQPVQQRMWEIPAGLLDISGEEPLQAAKRELREETDYEAGQWDLLVDYYNTPGSSNEAGRVYLARDITLAAEPFERFDEEAQMEKMWVPLSEVTEAIMDGSVHNPTLIMGTLAFNCAKQHNLENLRPADTPWFPPFS